MSVLFSNNRTSVDEKLKLLQVGSLIIYYNGAVELKLESRKFETLKTIYNVGYPSLHYWLHSNTNDE